MANQLTTSYLAYEEDEKTNLQAQINRAKHENSELKQHINLLADQIESMIKDNDNLSFSNVNELIIENAQLKQIINNFR